MPTKKKTVEQVKSKATPKKVKSEAKKAVKKASDVPKKKSPAKKAVKIDKHANVAVKNDNYILKNEDHKAIIKSILKQNDCKEFINHQLTSYKQFITKDIGDIIKQFNTRKLYFNYDPAVNKHKTELHIDFLDYNIGPPTIHENDGSYQQMTPMLARLRNLTYRAPLSINLKLTRIERCADESNDTPNLDIEDIKEQYFNNIKFGQIPIMVKSHNCILNKKDGYNYVQKGECQYDYGGYFIISGNEKVIVSQERMAEGEPFVFNNQKKSKCIEIEIRCVSDQHFSVVMNNLIRLKFQDDTLEFDSPSFKTPVPIFLLFKCLGIKTDKHMIQNIVWELGSGNEKEDKFIKIIKNSFLTFKRNPKFDLGNDLRKYQELLVTYLTFKGTNKEIKLNIDDKINYMEKILKQEVLPHLGPIFEKKYKYLGKMIRQLLMVHLGKLPYDDRDSYQNKRVDTPGRLLASLFRQCFNKLVKDIVKNLTKEIRNSKGNKDIFKIITNDNMYKIVKPNIIEGGLKYALATGNWGVRSSGKGNAKVGTAQVLNRLNYQSYLSHLRRINSPNDKKNSNGKIIKPRKLHGTIWGYICPIETPEGQPVGLVKNMAMCTKISYNCNSDMVKELIKSMGLVNIYKCTYEDCYKYPLVLVNGNWIGIHKNGKEFIKQLRDARRNGKISIFTGIYWNYALNEIKIYTDAGRLLRPLLIVDDGKLSINSEDIDNLKKLKYNFNYLLTPNNYMPELKINSLFKDINYSKGIKEGENKKIVNKINKNLDELRDDKGKMIWTKSSIIEYIDTNETNNCLICMSSAELSKQHEPYVNQFTHCEIDPSFVQGVVASVIPFPDRNQSPRNTYQCLKYDTPVLMADLTWKPICDIKVGEEVISFNPDPVHTYIERTKVVNQYVRPTEKKIYEMKLKFGDDTITATEDHKFMTQYGWMEIRDMVIGVTQILHINKVAIGHCKEKDMLYHYENGRVLPYATYDVVESLTEVENCMIADITTESDNHSFIADGFGVHNSAMGKQGMGVYSANFQKRMDTLAYVLNTVERPLVKTKFSEFVNYDKLPAGLNCMVAICSYTGYNQEDSVILNQGSVDMGLFHATFYRTYKDDEKKIQSSGREEKFAKPDPDYTQNMKPCNYEKLNENGFIRKNEFVTSDDVIIGKVLPLKNKMENNRQIYRDCSTSLKANESGFIDSVYTDRNADGFRFVKIKTRTPRIPSIGDKFSSRCGQKGTAGILYPREHMPYNKDGIAPDIIMNPHAIPSRMTIGQIMECLMGKAGAELGGHSDCTPFNDLTEEQIGDVLLNNGFNFTGDEVLYSGAEGTQMNVKVYMGPTYYQRLKHMVMDKIHSRASGPVVQLTRQPAEGRSRDGGLRLGEMERDCGRKGTRVSLYQGLSLTIENMEDCKYDVLGYSSREKGMVKSKQTKWLNKGERDCVKLTFNDGRTMSCTPDHKLLTSDDKWVKAKDLKVGTDKIKTGIKYPLINIKDEMELCKGWKLKVGKLVLKCDTKQHYLRSMAFARIIGYLITDGHISGKKDYGALFLGHMIDVKSMIDDLEYFQEMVQTNFKNRNLFCVTLRKSFVENIKQLKGILTGNKTAQKGGLPEFILDKKCPLPIVREFLGGLFGGDGHTCYLGLHRGKRDLLTSVSFSQSKYEPHRDSLTEMMKNIQTLLKRFGIKKTTLQKQKETHCSKKKSNNKNIINHTKCYELVLHLDINELMPFYEKIGFRHCCHKNQRLEAGVTYKRLRNEVTRQRQWLTKRVDELTNYAAKKKKDPKAKVLTKEAINQAVEELKKKEALVHEYAIPTKHAILEHLVKKTAFGKFNSKSFPTAEDFMKEIGAYEWFLTEEDIVNDKSIEEATNEEKESEKPTKKEETKKEESEKPVKKKKKSKEEIMEKILQDIIDEVGEKINKEEPKKEESNEEKSKEKSNNTKMCYGVCRDSNALPTMNLTLIDRRDDGKHEVYDIQVEDTHSFTANGIVAHNCMIAHGTLAFLKERLTDVSDKFRVHICKGCGSMAVVNDDDKYYIYKCNTCSNKYSDFVPIDIPYACKLLMQELQGMMITPKFILN